MQVDMENNASIVMQTNDARNKIKGVFHDSLRVLNEAYKPFITIPELKLRDSDIQESIPFRFRCLLGADIIESHRERCRLLIEFQNMYARTIRDNKVIWKALRTKEKNDSVIISEILQQIKKHFELANINPLLAQAHNLMLP